MPTYSISKREIEAWKPVFKHDKKWHSADEQDKYADFSYGYRTLKAKIQPFYRTLGHFHDKLSFFKILNKSDNVNCVPVTYLSMDEFIHNRRNDNSIWFFKISKYDCGSGVTPFLDNYDGVKNVIENKISSRSNKRKKSKREYIIQKGVENLMLYKGHKFDIRIHILITQHGEVYAYKDACMRISYKKFSNDCDCKRHQCTNGSLGANVQYTNEWPDWENVYPSVKKSIKEIILAMTPYIYKEKGRYLLIGADFIIDNDNKAWVLEFNTYPNLFYKPDPHMQPTITSMLKTMLHILTSPPKPTDIQPWDFVLSYRSD
jgi:hypothetical protein